MGAFGSVIKSIQRGVLILDGTSPDTVTITAVDTAKSVVLINGSGSGDNRTMPRAVLTNTTTITFDNVVAATSLIAWQVVEFY